MPRPRVPDALAALAVAVALQVEIWLVEGGPRGVAAVTVGGALLFAGAIALRRSAPPLMAVLASMTFAGAALLGGEMTTTLSMVFAAMFVAFSIGLHLRAVAGAVGFLAATWIDIVAAPDTEYEPVSDLFFTAVIVVGGPWFAGRALARWRERAEELEELTERLRVEREHRARVAVLDERARIAREMHDVVAHSVSLMVVQAGGARRMLDEDPEESRTALESVEAAGRQALQELRRALGMLRDGGEPAALSPQPGTAQLPELVARTRASGVPVDLAVDGAPRALPPGVDLAAYRIVQEALTNTVKHAGPAEVRVRLAWSPGALELTVADDGRGPNGTVATDSGGHGLIGMRERVAAYGGTFSVGAGPDGGFEVRARIPIEEPRA